MASFVSRVRELLAVEKSHQYSSETIPNIVDILASSIEILVDALEKTLNPSIINNVGQTDILCKRLKFLNVVLRDTPFRCTKIEGSTNILEEIESIANETEILFDSFFLTTGHVNTAKMDMQFSVLLSKLEVVEEKIKEQCAMVFERQNFTTPNLTPASIYIVDSLLDDLKHLLHHKADLVVEVKDQIETLYDELYSSRLIVRDIDLQQNKELFKYEIQLIDLAYQAEYIIACFAGGEVPVWYLAFRLESFIQKSKPTRASLKKIQPNSGVGGAQVAESSKELSSSQVEAKSVPEVDEIIVGFKETTRQIADNLFGGPNNLQIISIIGMGGLGKTTLARKLYNHPNALLRFDKCSWCVVSRTYRKRKLLIDILSSISALNKDEISKMEDHQLSERIYKNLKGTRYLIVVDDIWKKEVWDDLKRYFPDDRNGSRILFTSRNKDVPLEASSEPLIYDLPLLTENDCWDLLHKKVFPNSICPQELQNVGMEVARNCKGLPLAVVGIAAVLAHMDKKESLWQHVATNLTSYISKDENILEFSYEHLPSHLKPCFLYMGMFGEDEEIPVRQLLSLWISNGFIPKNEHKGSEDIAEDYLMELINRSMVQVTKRRSDNGVKTFTVHDLMREMCIRLADKEKFLTTMNNEFSTHKQHHHIHVHSGFSDFRPRLIGVHFRSLLDEMSLTVFATLCMKRLRVLKFPKAYGEMTMESLVQLRHLECAACLSNVLSHMNLEFLSMGEPLQRDIQLNMPKLRHLHLGHMKLEFLSIGQPLETDMQLNNIPELRHLYLDQPFLYSPFKYLNMSQTNSLQTLSGIVIQNLEDEERLRCFLHLRRLKCEYAKGWEECSPNLISLAELVSLNIRGTNLTKLKAINFPNHIKKLSLCRMVLSCELMSSIGTLAHLEIFKLLNVEFEGRRWNTEDNEFQKLKFLKLDWATLEEWNTFENHFPTLEHLVLKRCPELKFLPSELGDIPTLQMIEVSYCNKDLKSSAMDLRQKQEDEGNELLRIIISSTLAN